MHGSIIHRKQALATAPECRLKVAHFVQNVRQLGGRQKSLPQSTRPTRPGTDKRRFTQTTSRRLVDGRADDREAKDPQKQRNPYFPPVASSSFTRARTPTPTNPTELPPFSPESYAFHLPTLTEVGNEEAKDTDRSS